MDESDVIFQLWDEGQPNKMNYEERCAVITLHAGKKNAKMKLSNSFRFI